ncbi:VCBS domain-containing protein, partial [Acidovorax sp. CCYZU-2555]|uniref:VCBS domain-containing protein n=1 Tax=Acidovorax sp. CCYZU-2555 TaxID=2835042 RepID=UPI001BD10A76
QALGAGQTLTETREVVTADGTKSNVVITINGTNDVPTLGTGVAAVTEDVNVVGGKLSTSGTVTISDVDAGESSFKAGAAFTSTTGAAQLGTLVFNTDGSYSYSVDNSKVQYLKAGESVVETYTVTSKDNSATTTIKITINGTNEAPVVQAVTGTAPEDNTVAIVLRGTDEDGTVASFQLTSLAANGTFYKDSAGTQALTTSDVINATSNGATIYFKPTADWSGTTTFNYNAKDNLGQVSASTATGTITVTPVADTPVVNVQVGSGSTPVTTSITATTVGAANAGHTITAKNADGGNASVSVITGTNHDGFGVAGAITTNTAAASEELAGNGTKSESLTIAFNVPVTKITVQFAWLASGEQARYVMYDEAGKVIKTATVQGVTDTVDEQFSLTAPVGTTIGKIVFDAPRNGDDYLIHKVTYTTASTYPLTITADPRDVDHSENISKVIVDVPKGVTLSAGKPVAGSDTQWELPLESNGSYSVSVNGTTKAVTITGLSMTVPENVSVGEIKVTATAKDGESSTADATYSYKGPLATNDVNTATLTSENVTPASTATLATFTGNNESNPWRFSNSTSTYATKTNAAFTNNSALSTDQGKWLVSTVSGNGRVDANRSDDQVLVLTDRNGQSGGDAKLVTPTYSVTTAGTTLQFEVKNVNGLTGGNADSATWQLFKSTNGGTSWSAAEQGGDITAKGIITTGALEANTAYRIVMTVREGYTDAGDANNATVSFDNFQANIAASAEIKWSSSAISGSVTSNDMLGTQGETSTLSVFNGTSWVNAAAGGTTVSGSYGTLVLKSDGSYTYTPKASAEGAGQVEHFAYKLTQADGDTATANLDITINATGPGATSMSSARMAMFSMETSEHEVHSTTGNDTLLGTAEDDLFVWHQGDAGTVGRPVTDVVKNFGTSGNDKLDLADLLQGEEASSDLSKFLHLETRTEADGKTIDTVINVSTAGTLDAAGNGFNQQILVEGVNLTGTSHDQNTMIKELIEQGKLKIDHSGS